MYFDLNDPTNQNVGSIYEDSKIKTEYAQPINIFTKINNNNEFDFYPTPSDYSYFGKLDYEGSIDYITTKLNQTGPAGHSPLLGYAFDGFPIYGPIGYDISDNSYNDAAQILSEQNNFAVKLMKSNYTGSEDSFGNPRTYSRNWRFRYL